MTLRCKLSWLSIAALSVVLISGCDHNKPSPGTFKAALQAHFDQEPQCLSIRIAKFPVDAFLDDKGQATVRDGFGMDRTNVAATLAALKGAGLLTAQESVKTVPSSGLGDAPKSRKVITYAVAPENQSVWQTRGNVQLPCYGYVHVKSVDNYTEPDNTSGQTESTVSYTYNIDRIAPWAQNAALLNAIPELKAIVSADHPAKTLLVLTHNGWMQPTP
jgi:hypothetical protein